MKKVWGLKYDFAGEFFAVNILCELDEAYSHAFRLGTEDPVLDFTRRNKMAITRYGSHIQTEETTKRVDKARYDADVLALMDEPEHEDLSDLCSILGPNYCKDCD
jgi:hypothetical protein